MNVINVGFNSNHWNILVEGSDEYKNLSIALDNGDNITARHIMNTIIGLLAGDYDTAYREAHDAVKSSGGSPQTKDKTVRCPFCGGDGVIEFEDTPTTNGYHDPADAVDAEVPCNACGGDGAIEACKLLDTYAEGSYSEHVIMSVIRGSMPQAKELAQDVMREIMSHDTDNFEKSIEGLGE